MCQPYRVLWSVGILIVFFTITNVLIFPPLKNYFLLNTTFFAGTPTTTSVRNIMNDNSACTLQPHCFLLPLTGPDNPPRSGQTIHSITYHRISYFCPHIAYCDALKDRAMFAITALLVMTIPRKMGKVIPH